MDTLAEIQHDFTLNDGRLYGESSKPGERPSAVAFDWSVGVMLRALDAAARIDPAMKPRLADYVGATRVYWNDRGPVPGYDVLPTPKPADRYYDDNEWMVLALVEASDVLRSMQPLTDAEDTYRFVRSGLDDKLGGGIYWRESDKASKNTCSNGPGAAAALALYRKTHRKNYLVDAVEIYRWTRATLEDPSDGLYWDSIGLGGRIGRAKWSYNTALMLQDAAELFSVTKQPTYATDAKRMQAASLAHWVGEDGSLLDDGKFMFLLVDAWLEAYRLVPSIADPRAAVLVGLQRLHDHGRDALGHYPVHWNQVAGAEPYSPFNLIDQAAAARAFLSASEARG